MNPKRINYPLHVVGTLVEIPKLRMDRQGDLFSVIKLQTVDHPTKQTSILIIGNEALKIRQFGFAGLSLLIKCELNSNLFISDNVIFLDNFTPGSENQDSSTSGFFSFSHQCETITRH